MSICDRLRILFAKLVAVIPGRLPFVPCYWAGPGLASHSLKELPGVYHSSGAEESTTELRCTRKSLCAVRSPTPAPVALATLP